jgi:TRAP-type C4-dicarboxylate transport system permease small subunit
VSLIASAYGQMLRVLAIAAGVLMCAIAIMVVYDVTVRNLGFQPPSHTIALAEYGLLYITMLASPWLVRTKGHVYIELITAAVGPGPREVMARAVYVICVATCAVLAYYSGEATWVNFERGAIEVRSFDMPKWLLFAGMPVGFSLMAIEFGRYLAGFDSMYTGEAGIRE